MENASKALLMAAGVLIGMLVISLAVYLFVSFGTASAEIQKEQEETQLEKFNTQFSSYVSKEENTIYDVVTVANLASENNIYYQFEKKNSKTNGADNYISVYLDNSELPVSYRGYIEKGYNSKNQLDYNELIRKELETNDLTRYKCEVTISKTTRKSLPSNFYKKIKEKKNEKVSNIFLDFGYYHSRNFLFVFKL